ncbi:MAG: hypothetical protein V4436_00105 [Patescibacteria group bacterium]
MLAAFFWKEKKMPYGDDKPKKTPISPITWIVGIAVAAVIVWLGYTAFANNSPKPVAPATTTSTTK